MKKFLVAVALLLALGLMIGCSKQAPEDAVDPVEQAWEDLNATYNELETATEKTELFEAFMREYPGSEHVGQLAGAVAYYRGEELDDPAGAYAILAETLAENTDPEVRYEIGTSMFPLAMELGESMDLGAVAEELAATRPLTFSEMIDVADLALDRDQWQLGATYAEAALDRATPEAFLADYPDDDFTAEEAAAKADRRRVMSLADLGWALWNMGETDEATSAFEGAEPLKTVTYVGAADTPIDLYRGQAMLAAGDAFAAMEVLAPGAIMGSDDDAMSTLREAYVAEKGSEEGFDDWMWSKREELAREVDTFTLADYEGNTQDFAALADGKVTLLAFWFPT